MPSHQHTKKAQHAWNECAVCKGEAQHHIDGQDVCSSCFVDNLIKVIGVLDHCSEKEKDELKARYKSILCEAVDKAMLGK